MAKTAIYLAQIRRQIERLRDPYPLSDAERRKLTGLLEDQDRLEVERRRREIREGNRFMAHPTNHSGWTYWTRRDELTDRLSEVIRLAKTETGYSVRGIKAAQKEIERLEAKGYKNPNLLSGARSDLSKWQNLLDSYVKSVELTWQKIPVDVRDRFWHHRGDFSLSNLPQMETCWERVFWPYSPTSERQAYIEVLTSKLEVS